MNKLLEVYSKGLFNSLTNEQVGDVVELFQNITLSDPKKESFTRTSASITSR